MTYLSKNIFRICVSDQKTSNIAIKIYNSQVYLNPYVKESKLSSVPKKYFYCPPNSKQVKKLKEKIDGLPSMVIGHGSPVKADMFTDNEKFMPFFIQLMLKLYEQKAIFINKQLIKKVMDSYNFPNNTNYYVAEKKETNHFLNVNYGKYSFIAYS